MSHPTPKLVWNICISCLVLLHETDRAVTLCFFPQSLTLVGEWSSHATLYGNTVGRTYSFSSHWMNESIKTGQSENNYYNCHAALTLDTYIVSKGMPGNLTVYKCFRFDQWSSNVVQLAESIPSLIATNALCDGNNMEASEWPLIMRYLDYGYIPCPDIGGFDMDVLDETGYSFCYAFSSGQNPRFESECIYGEGIHIEFPSSFCKGDMPLARKEQLLCLGHKKIGNYTHMIVTSILGWPKIFSIKYISESDDRKIMYFSEDIRLNLNQSERGRTWKIVLTKKNYPSLCEDEFDSCKRIRECTEYNKLHCKTACKNYTSCLSDQPDCAFDHYTQGEWLEQSITGKRLIKVGANTIHIDKLNSFKCLGIYSSTLDGPKPLVKVLNNGCKPRFACLDMKYFTPGMIRYRLSQSVTWPYKEPLVRGDLCSESMFEDDPFPSKSDFRNQNHKILLKATSAQSAVNRQTVMCNLPHLLTFTVNIGSQKCRGSLSSCTSGDKMVLTFGPRCNVSKIRIFYRCLADYHINSQTFIFTDRADDPNDLQCWIFREDIIGNKRNIFLLLHSGDCNNETRISLDGVNYGIPYIFSFNYSVVQNDLDSDSCTDVPQPTPTTSAKTMLKFTSTPYSVDNSSDLYTTSAIKISPTSAIKLEPTLKIDVNVTPLEPLSPSSTLPDGFIIPTSIKYHSENQISKSSSSISNTQVPLTPTISSITVASESFLITENLAETSALNYIPTSTPVSYLPSVSDSISTSHFQTVDFVSQIVTYISTSPSYPQHFNISASVTLFDRTTPSSQLITLSDQTTLPSQGTERLQPSVKITTESNDRSNISPESSFLYASSIKPSMVTFSTTTPPTVDPTLTLDHETFPAVSNIDKLFSDAKSPLEQTSDPVRTMQTMSIPNVVNTDKILISKTYEFTQSSTIIDAVDLNPSTSAVSSIMPRFPTADIQNTMSNLRLNSAHFGSTEPLSMDIEPSVTMHSVIGTSTIEAFTTTATPTLPIPTTKAINTELKVKTTTESMKTENQNFKNTSMESNISKTTMVSDNAFATGQIPINESMPSTTIYPKLQKPDPTKSENEIKRFREAEEMNLLEPEPVFASANRIFFSSSLITNYIMLFILTCWQVI